MKLIGAKYLDANDYEKLVIRNYNEDLKVNVEGKVRCKTLKADFPFTKDLRTKDEDDTVVELVDYFLRYNLINKVEECVCFPRIAGYFIGVLSDKRNMFLQISLNDITKQIPKKILDKFHLDRYIFCISNDEIKNYEIYTSNVSSYKEEETEDKRTMKIYLKRKNCVTLTGAETEFFEQFLREKLKAYEEEVHLEKEDDFYTYKLVSPLDKRYYLKFGDICITMKGNILLPTLDKVIMEHNDEINNAKSMQLKMKGY